MPDPQEELRSGEDTPFHTFWVETKLGVRYQLPDMLSGHVNEAHRQLDMRQLPQITLRNVSDVVMIIPRHIIRCAGVGERCFWEVQ